MIAKLTAAACILAAPALMFGQADSVPMKIGVIDLQQAIAATQEGKRDLSQLQQKYAKRRADLQTQDKEIAAIQDRLQNQTSMLSDAEKYALERQLNDKQRMFKEGQDDYQYDTQEDEQEVVATVGQKMMKLVNQYATQNHFALIISNQQNLVLYASSPVDITQPLVKLYDSTYPATASATSSLKSAPPAGTARH
ncbi:MAG: OmpH family outer membrane protein [Terriglobia bacterium]